MGLLKEIENNETVQNISVIEFYKKLRLAIVIEQKRLDVYLAQLASISAVNEPERAIEKNVQVKNQQALVEKLYKVEKDLATALNNFGLTLNDKEKVIFSMGLIQNRKNEEIARYLQMKEHRVRDVKSELKKELDDMIIYEQL